MLDSERQPTPREVRQFGLLWLLFFPALGLVALWRPAGLLGGAVVLGTAWLVSLLFNPAPRARQVVALALPLTLALTGAAARTASLRMAVVAGATAIGLAGAVAIWSSAASGRTIYRLWMRAAAPLGWTISQVILGLVFLLVFTPIGFLLRLAGYDPMHRRYDRAAPSYWCERPALREHKSYFRQF